MNANLRGRRLPRIAAGMMRRWVEVDVGGDILSMIRVVRSCKGDWDRIGRSAHEMKRFEVNSAYRQFYVADAELEPRAPEVGRE